MKRANLLCCISALVLAFAAASCSSDEVTNNNKGNGDCLPGSAVSFGGVRTTDADAAKRTYYGSGTNPIPVYWSDGDVVRIASNGQSALYAAPASVGANAAQTNLEYKADQTGGTPITWQDGDEAQKFYAFYPGNETTSFTTNGEVDITVPEDQSGTTYQKYDRNTPATAASNTHPLAFAIATATATSEDGSVTLPFTDFMNVVRIQVNNPSGYSIKKVSVKSKTTNQDVSGDATVSPTAVTMLTGNAEVYATVSSNTATTQDYIFYLLPQDYSDGLYITVEFDAGGINTHITNGTTTPFTKGQMQDIVFNLPLDLKKDLGLRVISAVAGDGTVTTLWAGTAAAIAANGNSASGIDGAGNTITISSTGKTTADAKPLYFATGNLIVKYPASNTSPKAAAGAYIGAPEYMVTTVPYANTNTERDLFGWADPTGWKTSTNASDYPASTPPTDISGNPSYDIARATIGGGTTSNTTWRLPTAAELAVLMQQVAAIVSTTTPWAQDGSATGVPNAAWSSSGTAGLTITSQVTGFTENSIFIPAAGSRGGLNLNLNTRGNQGYVRSGTLQTNNTNNSYNLGFVFNQWRVQSYSRIVGYSVRPVSE